MTLRRDKILPLVVALVALFLLSNSGYCEGFANRPPSGGGGRGRRTGRHRGGGNGVPPPRGSSRDGLSASGGGEDPSNARSLVMGIGPFHSEEEQDRHAERATTDDGDDNHEDVAETLVSKREVDDGDVDHPSVTIPRGGAPRFGPGVSGRRVVRAGESQENLLASTANYWSQALQTATRTVTKPFQVIKQKLFSKRGKKLPEKEAQLLKQLQTMEVRRVTAPNSTVLPPDVVQRAAVRAGLLGRPLQSGRVQELATALKRWYEQKGYVLHAVTGATLRPETATAEIVVQEPAVSQQPVKITVCKQMVIDGENGELLTPKQYRAKYGKKTTFGYEKMSLDDLNTTYVEVQGRTKANRIARAMRLRPGKPFRFEGGRWNKIMGSGVFSKVFQATPVPGDDGNVQWNVVATETAPRHLEYGLSRSLYTGSWEGEMDFEHSNLLGGGEKVGFSVRRGTQDALPSATLRFTDDKFGAEGGYDAEVFSEFIGREDNATTTTEADPLCNRRGATLRLRNPGSMPIGALSGSVERTSTKSKKHEHIASTSLGVGPFVKQLPFDARSNIDARVTVGSKFGRDILSSDSVDDNDAVSRVDEDEDGTLFSNVELLPYSSVTATTKQILPLFATTRAGKRPVIMALQHSLTASTHNLPRHEAEAQGTSTSIRGCSLNPSVSSAVRGTTELRIPVSVTLPFTKKQPVARGTTSVVLWGDWVFAASDASSPYYRKSSVGLGLRQNLQGLPLKLDLSYSNEGKIKQSFAMGSDFDV